MFGNIIKIDGNKAILKNDTNEIKPELMNNHVIFEEEKRKIVGEITKIDEKEISVLLIGEITNNNFTSGIIKKPAGTALTRTITSDELEPIIGKNSSSKDNLILGTSAIYPNFFVSIPLNSFFATHSAIIGNTGSGKSCGVARILQNLFLQNLDKPINSHIVLFDTYGEYSEAFNIMNETDQLGFKKYTAKITKEDEQLIKIPIHFLGADDLAILLSVNDGTLIPVLEKTLKLVYIFTSEDEKIKDYKNDIIAKCLLDILKSGKSGSSMRDQIIAVLSKYNTESLNLDSLIKQPGYVRTLKQCLNIDEKGKMNAILLVTEFLSQFERITIDNIVVGNNTIYTLNDLYYALEFALISEGTLNSDTSYSKNNILKTRLQTIINSEYKNIFEVNEYITKENYIQKLFQKTNGTSCQLININLSSLDDRFSKIITKLLSKLFFTYTTTLNPRGSFSINIILEEAHRYVQNDNDLDIIGYNIFDRITKEGRKYGTLLTFITQRPSELSTSSLSQCSNFIVFRIFHPDDIEIIKGISTSLTEETVEKLKTLNPGVALTFGTGFKIPLLVKMELPNPMPESTSLQINEIWFKN